MVKSASDLSVAELERILSSRKSRLDSLTKKKTKLQKDLTRVEKEITQLVGRQSAAAAGGRRKVLKRPKNAKPLSQFVTEILSKNKKGLTLAGLAEKVLESGYKTNSSNFNNVLYQCLYNSESFFHDEESGCYRLA